MKSVVTGENQRLWYFIEFAVIAGRVSRIVFTQIIFFMFFISAVVVFIDPDLDGIGALVIRIGVRDYEFKILTGSTGLWSYTVAQAVCRCPGKGWRIIGTIRRYC